MNPQAVLSNRSSLDYHFLLSRFCTKAEPPLAGVAWWVLSNLSALGKRGSRDNKRKSQKPKAKSQKPKAKSQKPKAKSQKPKAKSQKPKAKSQKPKAKSQKPKVKNQSQSRFVCLCSNCFRSTAKLRWLSRLKLSYTNILHHVTVTREYQSCYYYKSLCSTA